MTAKSSSPPRPTLADGAGRLRERGLKSWTAACVEAADADARRRLHQLDREIQVMDRAILARLAERRQIIEQMEIR